MRANPIAICEKSNPDQWFGNSGSKAEFAMNRRQVVTARRLRLAGIGLTAAYRPRS